MTGCAGFVGSHSTEALLAAGHAVRGIDAFTSYYEPAIKRTNLSAALSHPGFELVEADLATTDCDGLLDGVDAVLHLAGQPGVRSSWEDGFEDHVRCNITATQRLLEAARRQSTQRFVAASSSSIYGDADSFPTSESVTPLPVSPYGVTKLAAEHMVTLYGTNFGLSTVSLRYFTVYGPRQRPDMAIQRMIRSSLGGPAFPLFGDGSASRSFTFIGDVVRANLAALEADVAPGTAVNLSGDEIVSVTELLELVGTLTGVDVPVDHFSSQPGDARHTGGATERAAELLGWTSSTPLADGISEQIRWNRATAG